MGCFSGLCLPLPTCPCSCLVRLVKLIVTFFSLCGLAWNSHADNCTLWLTYISGKIFSMRNVISASWAAPAKPNLDLPCCVQSELPLHSRVWFHYLASGLQLSSLSWNMNEERVRLHNASLECHSLLGFLIPWAQRSLEHFFSHFINCASHSIWSKNMSLASVRCWGSSHG